MHRVLPDNIIPITRDQFRRIAFPVALLGEVLISGLREFGHELPAIVWGSLSLLNLGLMFWSLRAATEAAARLRPYRKTLIICYAPGFLYLLVLMIMGGKTGLTLMQAVWLGTALFAVPFSILMILATLLGATETRTNAPGPAR